MGRSTITHLVIIQAVGLAVLAFLASADANERGSAATARMEEAVASRADVRGDLKCPMPDSNTGEACTLEIVNRENGETLRVASSNAAMKLFQDGKTRVVATGTFRSDGFHLLSIQPDSTRPE